MSGSEYKIKGHQKARPVKPYERPQEQGLVGKVKQWLSPSAWSSYFQGGSNRASSSEPSTPSTSRDQDHPCNHLNRTQTTSHEIAGHSSFPSYRGSATSALVPKRPPKSAALSSENVSVCEEDVPDTSQRISKFADSVKEPFPDPGRRLFTPSITPSSSSRPRPSVQFQAQSNLRQSIRVSTATGSGLARPLPSNQDMNIRSNGIGDSDSSWVAEEDSEGVAQAQEGEEEQDDEMNCSNVSDKSWVAEEVDDQPKPSSTVGMSKGLKSRLNFRPISISLAKKELSSLSSMDGDTPTTGTPPTTPFTYALGEGKLGVVEQSSYLLTPGAETTVKFLSNPVYSSNKPKDKEPSGATSSEKAQIEQSQPLETASSKPVESLTSTSTFSSPLTATSISPSPFTSSMSVDVSSHHRHPLMTSTVTKLNQRLRDTAGRPTGGGMSGSLPASTLGTPAQASSKHHQQHTPVQQRREEMAPSSAGRLFSGSLGPSKLTSTTTQRVHALINKSTTPFTSKDTSESIKRSPFTSPFYSGRTSYGGAAAGQKIRAKRPRMENTAPSLVTQHVTVRPTPAAPAAPGGRAAAAISETAKRILSSLQTSNSPLSDARRMPMRQPPLEEQPSTKRRRVGQDVLSPPPVTPLRPSSHLSRYARPRSSPDPKPTSTEKQITTKGTAGSSTEGSLFPTSRISTASSKVFTPSLGPPVINFSSAAASDSKPFSAISSLKFTPAPVNVAVETSKSRKEDRSSPGTESDEGGGSPRLRDTRKEASGMARKVGGKIRHTRRSHQHFSRKTSQEDGEDEPDATVNPLGPPPSVGLSLGAGKTLSTIKFHSQYTPSSNVIGSGPSSRPLNFSVSTSSNSPPQKFSFSVPVPLSSSTSQTPKQVSTSFGFAMPKQLPVSSASMSTPPVTTPSQYLSMPKPATIPQPAAGRVSQRETPSFGPSLVKPRPKEPTPKQPLPLKSASIEEVFKQGIQPVKGSSSPAKSTEVGGDVVDLTEDDEGSSGVKIAALGSLKPLPQFTPSAGSWSCTVCCVSNKPDATKCVACQSPKAPSTAASSSPLTGLFGKPAASSKLSSKPLTSSAGASGSLGAQFAPPTGSWECSTCMVSNKDGSNACVACSTPKPTGGNKSVSPLVLAAKFAPPTGSWECEVCMVNNKVSDTKCVACSTPKPGSKKTTDTSATGASSLPGTSAGHSSSTGFKPLSQFAPIKDSWSCDTCLVSNTSSDESCVACSAPKPGAKPSTSSSQELLPKFGSSGGLVLGSSGGLALGSGGLKVVGKEGEGPSVGLKFGSGLAAAGQSSGGFKLSGGLSLGGLGKKLQEPSGNGASGEGKEKEEVAKSGEGGLRLGAGGLKLGSGGLSLGGAGMKLGGTTGGLTGVISLGAATTQAGSEKDSSKPSLSGGETGSGQLSATSGLSLGGSLAFGGIGNLAGIGQLAQTSTAVGDGSSKQPLQIPAFQSKDSAVEKPQLSTGEGSQPISSNPSASAAAGPSFSFSASKGQVAATSGAGFSLGTGTQLKFGSSDLSKVSAGPMFGQAVTSSTPTPSTGTDLGQGKVMSSGLSLGGGINLGGLSAGTFGGTSVGTSLGAASAGATLSQTKATPGGVNLGGTSVGINLGAASVGINLGGTSAGISLGQAKSTAPGGVSLGQPSTGINLGQPSAGINLGGTSAGVNLGGGSAAVGVNLGQARTTQAGINLGQPSTGINFGQQSVGINLGQPKTTAAPGVNLGQPSFAFGKTDTTATSGGSLSQSGIILGSASQAGKNLFATGSGQASVSNPLTASPFVFGKSGQSSTTTTATSLTTSGPAIKFSLPSNTSSQQPTFAFGSGSLNPGGLTGTSQTTAAPQQTTQLSSIFGGPAASTSTAPATTQNPTFQFSAGKTSTPVLQFGTGTSTGLNVEGTGTSALGAGTSGLGVGASGVGAGTSGLNVGGTSGTPLKLVFGAGQQGSSGVGLATTQAPQTLSSATPTPTFQFGSGVTTASGTTGLFGGSKPFTFTAGGSEGQAASKADPQPFRFGQGALNSGTQQQPLGGKPTFQFGSGGVSAPLTASATSAGQQQQQQQPLALQFGRSAGSTPTPPIAAPPSGAAPGQGFNFSMGGPMNLNFGASSQTSFTAESSQSTPDMAKRIIKKATRRRK